MSGGYCHQPQPRIIHKDSEVPQVTQPGGRAMEGGGPLTPCIDRDPDLHADALLWWDWSGHSSLLVFWLQRVATGPPKHSWCLDVG